MQRTGKALGRPQRFGGLCSQGVVKGAKHLLALDNLGEQCKLAVWVIPCGSEKRDNPLSNRF